MLRQQDEEKVFHPLTGKYLEKDPEDRYTGKL
jgi:hypothetical protein